MAIAVNFATANRHFMHYLVEKHLHHIIQLTMEQEGGFLELKRDPGLT